MSNRKQLGIFGGNDRLLEAIIENSKPLDLTTGDDEAQRETTLLNEKESELRGKEWGMSRKHWTDQARFRYNGKRTAKRKGTIRNHVESRTIARIK